MNDPFPFSAKLPLAGLVTGVTVNGFPLNELSLARTPGGGDVERLPLADSIGVIGGGRRQIDCGGEYDVHPIIGGTETLRRKAAAATVEHIVGTIFTLGQRAQRLIVHPGSAEIGSVKRVAANRCKVRSHISDIGTDGHRGSEVDLLPSGCGLIGEWAVASRLPVLVHRFPIWVPVSADPL